MGLENCNMDSIWDNEGNYLNKNSKGWKARTTGCDCCSTDITELKDLKGCVISNFVEILIAQEYLKWDLKDLINKAKKRKKIS
jgi:hypothetical protein